MERAGTHDQKIGVAVLRHIRNLTRQITDGNDGLGRVESVLVKLVDRFALNVETRHVDIFLNCQY